MTITKAKLDEWRKLAEAATPGPWFQTGEPWFHAEDGVLAGSDDGNIAFMIADCDTEMFCGEREEYEGPVKLSSAEADAAFIVAAREAVPALLDALAEKHETAVRLSAECFSNFGAAANAIAERDAATARAEKAEAFGIRAERATLILADEFEMDGDTILRLKAERDAATARADALAGALEPFAKVAAYDRGNSPVLTDADFENARAALNDGAKTDGK